jgi:phosphopantothenoylcysteine decarboxylase / phosphopantothenate---cysteine ligase
MHCLITAGPTREYLDPVRFLSNGSSGKMGYALAEAARARGWTVTVVSGPVSIPAPAGVEMVRVVSAQEMYDACAARFAGCDLFIAVAAVADYRPVEVAREKTKKIGGRVGLELVPTVDVLKTLAATKRPDQSVVGFAAETTDIEGYARRKLVEKNCDWIVANDVSAPGLGMEADRNAVVILGRDGSRHEVPAAGKDVVAREILRIVVK